MPLTARLIRRPPAVRSARAARPRRADARGRPLDTPAAHRTAAADWLRALQRTAPITPAGSHTLAGIVDAKAALHPGRPALIGEDAMLTYGDLADLSVRCALWARQQGLGKGDRVALLMANGAAYPAIWIGLSRVGVVTALINANLVGAGLRHCLDEAAAGHVIVDAGRAAALREAGTGAARVWSWKAAVDGARSFDHALAGHDPGGWARLAASQDRTLAAPVARDPALLVFTSGTTGLPKAASVSHHRTVMWAEWFAGILDATADDRLYDCLPMYHSIGGVAAVGAMLAAGGSVVVRRTFSATTFWRDVRDSGATIFQYIGELCRFLLASPPAAAERDHRLRLICGNGLREDVWRAFVARFAIPRVVEFYAATEGTFSLFNLEGRPGAVGRVPGFMAHRSPVALVRSDPVAGEPARGGDGRCQPCAIGEPGEAIGRMVEGDGRAVRFEGYTDRAASERKILRDVFAPGDAWYRTGDLMSRDGDGFYRFLDRIGDTYRWRGENVSTTEVAQVLRGAPGVIDAAVFGVEIAGAEGRAGMAALVPGPDFDRAVLHARVAAELPRYARPLFLRLCRDLALTGTFRPRTAALRAAGFDPARVDGDALLLDEGGAYVPLDADLHRRVVGGAMRL